MRKSKEGDRSRHIISTGISGIVIDRDDFMTFKEYVTENVFNAEPSRKAAAYKKKAAFKKLKRKRDAQPHVPFNPTSLALDFAISIIWPGQSFASISLFRGENTRRLAVFHKHRFDAVAGNNLTMTFVSSTSIILNFIAITNCSCIRLILVLYTRGSCPTEPAGTKMAAPTGAVFFPIIAEYK
jgi:hypothetical protein